MKQNSMDFLINSLEHLTGLNFEGEKIIDQAKEMHKQELEATYNHAMWALMDTGHGEGFDEYYKNTYEKEN